MTISTYSGESPSRGLSQTAFNTAIEYLFSYLKDFPAEVNSYRAQLLALLDAEIYDAGTTYNPTDYTVPSFVYGSDGITYACIGSNVIGDNPVGSSSGDWQALVLKSEDVAPTGSVIAMMTSSVPASRLECDGSAVSRTTYAALFAAIADDYGVGDGSTTFNLPDLRGEVMRGWDHGAGNDPDAASRTDRGDGTTGDNVGTKQADAMETHEHTVKVVGTTAGTGSGRVCQADNTLATDQSGYLNNAGSSTENRPRNINVMWCVKY